MSCLSLITTEQSVPFLFPLLTVVMYLSGALHLLQLPGENTTNIIVYPIFATHFVEWT